MPCQDQLSHIISQMSGLTTWSQEFGTRVYSKLSDIRAHQFGFTDRLNQFGQRLDAFDARFDQIDQFHTTLQTNWDATHGHWSVPGAAFNPIVLTPEDYQAGGNQDGMDED